MLFVVFKMVPTKPLLCPICGGTTKSRGYVDRTIKDFYGHIIIHKVQQRQCTVCKAKHTILPDFIEPYQHYTR